MLRVALSLRYLMLAGSMAALLGSGLMFWEAATKIASGLRSALAPASAADGGKSVIASVVGAVDSCLFGVVLMVFAYSIAFGFVFDLDPRTRERLPAWMRLGSLHELKQTLVQVILVYLIVDFATDIANSDQHLAPATLVMPAAILLIAAAFRLMAEPAGARP